MATKQAQERAKVQEAIYNAGMDAENVAVRQGVYTYKRSFFYRMGMSPEKLGERIAAIPGFTVVEAREDWRAWPKTSYFVVRFTVAAGE